MTTKDSAKNEWQQACDGVLHILSTKRYAKKFIRRYACLYENLLSFLTRRKLIDKPVDKKYIDDFIRLFCNTTYKDVTAEQFYTCALRRLLEFHQKGSFDHLQKIASPFLLSATYESLLAVYREYRIVEVASTSENAEKKHLNEIRKFLHLLHSRRISSVCKIRFEDVQSHIRNNINLSSSRIRGKICILRSFFKFLIATKRAPHALLGFIPRIRHSSTFRLAAIWPEVDVKKLLSVINRKTALGKRDYAIVLLVSMLGFRIGDVRGLKIENIDWRKAVIHVTQQKTKNSQELPMSEDVGSALIDYLRNGRPCTSSRYVFVTHKAPYREFGETSCMYGTLERYRQKAGVLLPEETRGGWHSLRHSLATRLLEEDTPLPVIATILGHSSVETTRIYARTNIKQLRSAALEWEGF